MQRTRGGFWNDAWNSLRFAANEKSALSKPDLVQTTQLIANVGVIVGIVFLAIELQQNSDVMEAQARLNLIEIENEILTTLSEDDEIVSLVFKMQNGDELSAIEAFELTAFLQKGYRVLEWIYVELPNERRRISSRRVLLQFPVARQAWDQEKSAYDPAFVRFMEEGL